jgi:hypothetical protein
VLAYSAAIVAGMLIFIYAIVRIGNGMRERRSPAQLPDLAARTVRPKGAG